MPASPVVTQTTALLETYFWRYNRIASDEELFREYSVETSVAEVLGNAQLVKYLSEQGVPVDTRVALSPRMVRWIDTLCAAGDIRPFQMKLKDSGVTMELHNKWMKNPLFTKALNNRVDSILPAERSRVHQSLSKEAVGGNVAAIKLYLTMTGELKDETSGAKPETAALMQGILEILETYVPGRILTMLADDFDYLLVNGRPPIRTKVVASKAPLELPEEIPDL
jgi:Helix-turn-helix of insertion element transposase